MDSLRATPRAMTDQHHRVVQHGQVTPTPLVVADEPTAGSLIAGVCVLRLGGARSVHCPFLRCIQAVLT